jgi:hypothetical protein
VDITATICFGFGIFRVFDPFGFWLHKLRKKSGFYTANDWISEKLDEFNWIRSRTIPGKFKEFEKREQTPKKMPRLPGPGVRFPIICGIYNLNLFC